MHTYLPLPNSIRNLFRIFALMSALTLTARQATAADVIIDNINAEFTNTWTISSSNNNKYGANYAYSISSPGVGNYKMRWRPNLTAGNYLVYIWLPDGSSTRPTNAPFTVYDADGSATYEVNERGTGGYWLLLGTHRFNAGTGGYVELTNDADGTYVIGDAVRFEKTRSEEIVDNSSIAPSDIEGNWWSSSVRPGYYDSNYLVANSGGATDKIRWRPDLAAGNYEVYIRLPNGDTTRPTNAPFTVYYDGGSTTYLVNEQNPGGTWKLLGTHFFASGSNGCVELTDAGNGTYTIADAVKFVPAPTQYYLDPVNGSMSNSGSAVHPWGSLQEVFAVNKTFLGGDTIYLLGGYHGYPQIHGMPEAEVLITALPGQSPCIRKVRFDDATNFTLSNVTISPQVAGLTDNGRLVTIPGSCDHISVTDCDIYTVDDSSSWTDADWRAYAAEAVYCDGPNSSIIGNTMRNIQFGIVFSDVSVYSEASYNTIENFSGDAMRGLGDYQKFEYNLIMNSYDVNDGNHDDAFQSYRYTGEPIRGIVLRGNIILNYTDPNQPYKSSLQGIGCFNGPVDGWVIENNVISIDSWNGIALLGAYNCRIVNNTVVENPIGLSGYRPWIRISDSAAAPAPNSGNLVRNNLVRDIISTDGCVSDHNIITTSTTYNDFFVDYTHFDFHLKATASSVNSGSSNQAATLDFDAIPQDATPDIGADEY